MAPRALSVVLLVALSACSSREQRLDGPVKWKLTLPVDNDGGFEGVAAETRNIEESSPPWFVAGVERVFIAPVNGATTKGSKYARCELRELNGDGSLAAWTIEKGGRLAATLSVDELPRTKKGEPGPIVIGQIHGPQDELCRLYFRDGKLTYSNDKSGPEEKERSFELGAAIPLGEKFEYAIEVRDGMLIVSAVHRGEKYEAREKIASFWEGKPLYFKAGVYVQVGRDGSGRGKVTFYDLAVAR